MKQRHLAELVDFYGRGPDDATEALVSLIETGLRVANERGRQEWAASHPDGKTNPYVTDAGKCPRQIFYSLTGVEETEELTTDSYINFGIGSAVEEWLGEVLSEAGLNFYREVRVEIPHQGTTVTGRIDFCFVHSGRLIELKTTSSRSMSFMLRNREQGRDEHRSQANLYLHAQRHGTIAWPEGVDPQPLTDAYLVYVTKDATRREPTINAWHVPYDAERAEADLSMLSMVAQAAKQGTDPGIPAEYREAFDDKGKLHWRCQYCPFQRACWDVNERGFAVGPKEGE